MRGEVVKDRHGTDSIGGGYKCGMVEFGRRCMEICGERPGRDVAARVVGVSNVEFDVLVSVTLISVATVGTALLVDIFVGLRIVLPSSSLSRGMDIP